MLASATVVWRWNTPPMAIPGKYGYQWAKWVQRLEVVTDGRKGYWAELGLSDRGDVGDVW